MLSAAAAAAPALGTSGRLSHPSKDLLNPKLGINPQMNLYYSSSQTIYNSTEPSSYYQGFKPPAPLDSKAFKPSSLSNQLQLSSSYSHQDSSLESLDSYEVESLSWMNKKNQKRKFLDDPQGHDQADQANTQEQGNLFESTDNFHFHNAYVNANDQTSSTSSKQNKKTNFAQEGQSRRLKQAQAEMEKDSNENDQNLNSSADRLDPEFIPQPEREKPNNVKKVKREKSKKASIKGNGNGNGNNGNSANGPGPATGRGPPAGESARLRQAIKLLNQQIQTIHQKINHFNHTQANNIKNNHDDNNKSNTKQTKNHSDDKIVDKSNDKITQNDFSEGDERKIIKKFLLIIQDFSSPKNFTLKTFLKNFFVRFHQNFPFLADSSLQAFIQRINVFTSFSSPLDASNLTVSLLDSDLFDQTNKKRFGISLAFIAKFFIILALGARVTPPSMDNNDINSNNNNTNFTKSNDPDEFKRLSMEYFSLSRSVLSMLFDQLSPEVVQILLLATLFSIGSEQYNGALTYISIAKRQCNILCKSSSSSSPNPSVSSPSSSFGSLNELINTCNYFDRLLIDNSTAYEWDSCKLPPSKLAIEIDRLSSKFKISQMINSSKIDFSWVSTNSNTNQIKLDSQENCFRRRPPQPQANWNGAKNTQSIIIGDEKIHENFQHTANSLKSQDRDPMIIIKPELDPYTPSNPDSNLDFDGLIMECNNNNNGNGNGLSGLTRSSSNNSAIGLFARTPFVTEMIESSISGTSKQMDFQIRSNSAGLTGIQSLPLSLQVQIQASASTSQSLNSQDQEVQLQGQGQGQEQVGKGFQRLEIFDEAKENTTQVNSFGNELRFYETESYDELHEIDVNDNDDGNNFYWI